MLANLTRRWSCMTKEGDKNDNYTSLKQLLSGKYIY